MTSSPLVSVVIPAYLAARTIARAVQSVLTQTAQPQEILVIDDGSPDDLPAAVAIFGDRVTLIRKPNGGAASARNLGIERATGDFIAFLDADDYWEPKKLARQLDVLSAYPEVKVVGCRWFEELPGEARVLAPVRNDTFYGHVLRAAGADAFEVAMCMWTGSLMISRTALADNRFVSGLEPAEDRDLWIRLATKFPLFLLPEPLATYVQEPGSLSRSNVDRDCGNMLRVVGRYAELLGPRGVRTQEAIIFRRWAAGHLGEAHPRNALAPAWKRLKLQPLSAQAWWILLKSAAWTVVSGHSRTEEPQ